MITLKNNELEVVINEVGAEIDKIIGVHDQINYMWKQDESLWGHSAPVLFPIVGALKNGKTIIENKEYKMNQHGFSRNSKYKIVSNDEISVTLLLEDNDETKKMYPYAFKLYVTYTLKDNQLKAEFKVVNDKEDHIYFQIGGHPAFSCPFLESESSNDYYIEFSQNETVASKVINSARGGMSREMLPLFENERRFFVRQALFNSDAIVVPHFKSDSIALKSINHNKSLVFYMSKEFDHVGLWTSKHVGGLLAIEPWVGHTDYVDFNGDFTLKEGIIKLNKDDIFTCHFTIEINQ